MSHKIQKQVLQLDLPSGHDSWRFQNELRDTFNNLVLPRLEKACNELGLVEGTVFKIDSLLLDTGEISRHGLSQEWAGQIEHQFKEQIKRLKIKGPLAAEKVEVQTSDQSDLAAVLHFLKLGVLPWWLKNGEASLFRKLLDEVLSNEPQVFIAKLKRLPNRALAIRRLLKLIPSDLAKKFRAVLSTQPQLSQQLKDALNQLNIVPSQDALLRLDSIEIISMLTENPADKVSLLHQWISQELVFGHSSSKEIKSIHKALINSTLNQISQDTLQTQLIQIFRNVFGSLEEEKVRQKPTSLHPKSQESREKLRPKENKLDTPGGKVKAHPNDEPEVGPSESERFSKANLKAETKAETDAEKGIETDIETTTSSGIEAETIIGSGTEPGVEIRTETESTQQAQNQKDGKSSNENETPSSTPTDTSTAPSPLMGAASDEEDTQDSVDQKGKQAPPLNQQDSHVFKQLERIRQAALDQQGAKAEQEGTDPNASASFTKTDLHEQSSAPPEHAPKTYDEEKITEESGQVPSKPTLAKDRQNEPVAQTQRQAPPRFSYELPQVEVEECYIANAGLILFWPFLGRFFKNLGFVENNQFKSVEDQEKAALLMQQLLGDTPELDEFALPLNKLLCALPIEHPITTEYTISDEEIERCLELLQSTIDNWGVLKGTSIPGFQSSFLNREAVLKRQENGWLLQVEKQAFDMLLEQMPWPLSIVKLTWMNEPIYVEW